MLQDMPAIIVINNRIIFCVDNRNVKSEYYSIKKMEEGKNRYT